MSHLDRAVRALRDRCAVYPWVVRVDVDDSSGYEVLVVYVKQAKDLRREILRPDPLGYRLNIRVEEFHAEFRAATTLSLAEAQVTTVLGAG